MKKIVLKTIACTAFLFASTGSMAQESQYNCRSESNPTGTLYCEYFPRIIHDPTYLGALQPEHAETLEDAFYLISDYYWNTLSTATDPCSRTNQTTEYDPPIIINTDRFMLSQIPKLSEVGMIEFFISTRKTYGGCNAARRTRYSIIKEYRKVSCDTENGWTTRFDSINDSFVCTIGVNNIDYLPQYESGAYACDYPTDGLLIEDAQLWMYCKWIPE